jgi:D-alanyl-D-alanine-carboxypeptidase/D-alanyl-D-alanine-endopeptidase
MPRSPLATTTAHESQSPSHIPGTNARVPHLKQSHRLRWGRKLSIPTQIALAFALASAAKAQTPKLSSAVPAAAEIFANTHSTAMVLVIVRDRETYLQGFGETSPGSGKAPGPDSLLRLCSLTKIFATDLLVKLMDDPATARLVRLDAPLQAFAPKGLHVPGPPAPPITLGDLATHTAGLPREVTPAPRGAPHFTFPDFDQRWAWLPRQRLRTTPGTAALYSNVGFDLLGDALAAAARKPYPQLLAERTTRPLGMANTTFLPTQAQCTRLLIGYHKPRGVEPPFCTPTDESAGSAGLYSTPADMVKWLEYLLGTSENPALRQNPAAQATYLQPSDLASVHGLDHAGDPTGIGLGWVHTNEASGPGLIIEKTGGGGGFTTYIAMLPAKHLGVFIALSEGGHWVEETATGEHHFNPFYATNNLLLALAGLPPMPSPPERPAPAPRAKRAAKHPAKHAAKRKH